MTDYNASPNFDFTDDPEYTPSFNFDFTGGIIVDPVSAFGQFWPVYSESPSGNPTGLGQIWPRSG